MFKKAVMSSILLTSLFSSYIVNADTYQEVSCSTDSVFGQNGCKQCFDGWVKAKDSTVGGLSDDWINDTKLDKLMFEEIQTMPEMRGLNGATWTEDKVADKFWEYTTDLKALYDEKQKGYVLKPGWKVTWLKSTEGSSYLLTNNPVEKWQNVGLLVYSIASAPILESGEVSTEESTHKECVLFKSGDAPVVPIKEKPKELPKTWPEQFILLLILAMFLAFGILRFKRS